MEQLAERIYDILSSDEWIDGPRSVLLQMFDPPEHFDNDTEAANFAYETMHRGFAFGLAFASTQRDPLESLWSHSQRADEAVTEVFDRQRRERSKSKRDEEYGRMRERRGT
jgi:hypothetical protein